MNKICKITQCYGCGVCAAVCPHSVIAMVLSQDGFYIPAFPDVSKCTQCGLCERVCSYISERISSQSHLGNGYVAISQDNSVISSCSSGGVGFEIGRLLIEKGYKAVSVRYNPEEARAEHFSCDSIEAFEQSKGSKYLQSFTTDAFRSLNKPGRYVVFGTPCQIDSISRMVDLSKRREDFILVDFFCHGVPSYHLWDSYIAYMSGKHKMSHPINALFRDKNYGPGKASWCMSLVSLDKKVFSSMRKDRDIFYSLFLGNVCLNKPCYDSCKFKSNNSSADIRIGDLWSKNYQESKKGMSAVIANTHAGESVISSLFERCDIFKEKLEVVCDGQMRSKLAEPAMRDKIVSMLSRKRNIRYVYWYYKITRKINSLLKRSR